MSSISVLSVLCPWLWLCNLFNFLAFWRRWKPSSEEVDRANLRQYNSDLGWASGVVSSVLSDEIVDKLEAMLRSEEDKKHSGVDKLHLHGYYLVVFESHDEKYKSNVTLIDADRKNYYFLMDIMDTWCMLPVHGSGTEDHIEKLLDTGHNETHGGDNYLLLWEGRTKSK